MCKLKEEKIIYLYTSTKRQQFQKNCNLNNTFYIIAAFKGTLGFRV